jgi:hypothetical protein
MRVENETFPTGRQDKTRRRRYDKNSEYDILILIYLLTAIGLTPGGSSTVHIYTQTIHRTTKKNNT